MIDEHYVYINSLVNKIKEDNNEAMAELERFRQSHPETAPHEFALRNLPA